MTSSWKPSSEGDDKAPEETTAATIQALKEALAQIRVCSRLEGLLLKKKFLNNGDSPEIHAQKVDKLKVLSESLASSTVKAEKRISDHRSQKEEALKVREVKASEVSGKEKELAAEIAELEKQRDKLEAELKKEDELSRSVASCRVEADVLNTWINFLEDTWVLQCSYTEIKEKQVSDELERHEDYFVDLAIHLLSAYKEKLGPSISRIGKFVENLKSLSEGSEVASSVDNEASKVLNPKKNLEEEYLEYEAKIITTFSVVDNMKEQFYAQRVKTPRKDDPRVKELFDDIEKLREEFESIERPTLEMETPTPKVESTTPKAESTSSEKPQGADPPMQAAEVLKAEKDEHPKPPAVKAEQVLDTDAELAKLESEFGKFSQDYSTEEIGGWEFDELERELRSGDSATSK
ncbi:hypothetical protein L1049_011760 [Liquidambar formosana]|uniref:Uncharacterized protein n=1 Tax=Liquidambar formosana TaxID=63359 RepID=A0AAP0RSM5_LIQFO